jgi:hypothetical protein
MMEKNRGDNKKPACVQARFAKGTRRKSGFHAAKPQDGMLFGDDHENGGRDGSVDPPFVPFGTIHEVPHEHSSRVADRPFVLLISL